MNLIKLKKPEADVNRKHSLYLQYGTITTLLVFIALFNVNFKVERTVDYQLVEQEIVQIEEIITTVQENRPPPPPRPSAPVEVPNDEIFVDEILDLDAELRFDDPIFLTPPPAPPTADAEVEEEEPEVFVVVERMPELIGGLQSIQSKIVYPEIARLAGIEGRVMVSFVIDEEGNVLNPVVVRGIGGGCDEAAVEAVRKAKFTPGMQSGRPVRVHYTLPVTFKLNVTERTSK